MNQYASNNGLRKLNWFVGNWNPAQWATRNGGQICFKWKQNEKQIALMITYLHLKSIK
jgi:hypothetical protein